MIIAAVAQATTVVLAAIGAFFFLVGTIGVLRLPDFYARTHAATKCDTLGAGAILTGLAALTAADGGYLDGLKLLVIAGLVLVSSPTAAHALARAAHRTGLKPWVRAPRGEAGERQ